MLSRQILSEVNQQIQENHCADAAFARNLVYFINLSQISATSGFLWKPAYNSQGIVRNLIQRRGRISTDMEYHKQIVKLCCSLTLSEKTHSQNKITLSFLSCNSGFYLVFLSVLVQLCKAQCNA